MSYLQAWRTCINFTCTGLIRTIQEVFPSLSILDVSSLIFFPIAIHSSLRFLLHQIIFLQKLSKWLQILRIIFWRVSYLYNMMLMMPFGIVQFTAALPASPASRISVKFILPKCCSHCISLLFKESSFFFSFAH